MIKKTFLILFLFCFNDLIGQNYQCFELANNKELKLDILPNKSIYFLGEIHNIASNDLLDFQFLQYLSKTYNINTFIKEGSCSYNYFLSEYLETGNENLLDTLLNSLGYYVAEQREFLNQLYTFNATVEKGRRIKIYSIDAESFFHTQALIRYWKKKWGDPSEEAIVKVFEELENFKSSSLTFSPSKKDKQKISQILSIVQPIFNSNEQDFEEYLKGDFIHLKMIVNNHATNQRNDKTLESNFQYLHQSIKSDAYFFSYGKLHAQKQKGWLADRLNKSLEFGNSVLTIKPYYKNSSIYWKGSEVELNDFDELDNDQKSYFLSLNCENNWLITPSTNAAYDFYIISKNQKGITVINDTMANRIEDR